MTTTAISKRLALVACAAALLGSGVAFVVLHPSAPEQSGPTTTLEHSNAPFQTSSPNLVDTSSVQNAPQKKQGVVGALASGPPPAARVAARVAAGLAAPTPASKLPLGAPSKAVLAAEVKSDVHATPPSLLAFADRLANLMENAFVSKQAAQAAFVELSECAKSQNKELSRTIQSLCLANAERLSKKYPSQFANSFTNLVNELSPDLLTLAGVAGRSPFRKNSSKSNEKRM